MGRMEFDSTLRRPPEVVIRTVARFEPGELHLPEIRLRGMARGESPFRHHSFSFATVSPIKQWPRVSIGRSANERWFLRWTRIVPGLAECRDGSCSLHETATSLAHWGAQT
jgi:hypothetical protein